MTSKEFTVWLAGYIQAVDILGSMDYTLECIREELKKVEEEEPKKLTRLEGGSKRGCGVRDKAETETAEGCI
jgi:hypothetical protein